MKICQGENIFIPSVSISKVLNSFCVKSANLDVKNEKQNWKMSTYFYSYKNKQKISEYLNLRHTDDYEWWRNSTVKCPCVVFFREICVLSFVKLNKNKFLVSELVGYSYCWNWIVMLWKMSHSSDLTKGKFDLKWRNIEHLCFVCCAGL